MVFYKNVYWVKYRNIIVPYAPPDHIPVLSKNEAQYLLHLMGGLLIRYIENWDSKSNRRFWYIIKDEYVGVEEFSSKTRNQMRKGLKHFNVKKISKTYFQEYGFEVYKAAFKKYDTFQRPMTEKQFVNSLNELDDNHWEFWGVFKKDDNQMIAFSQVFVYDEVGEFKITKFHPDFLKLRPSEALFFTLIEHYLGDRKFRYIHNGTRNLSHQTSIQQFLQDKFNFSKAYCRLKIYYAMPVKILVYSLFPFRKVIRHFRFKWSQMLYTLLFQEELKREPEKHFLYKLPASKNNKIDPEKNIRMELFKPSMFRKKRHKSSSLIYWFWIIITLGRYRILYFWNKEKSTLVHYSHIVPGFYKFPFMEKNSIQIINSYTSPGYRGEGSFVKAMSIISQLFEYSSLYIMTRQDNHPSIGAIETAGGKFISEIYKTKYTGRYKRIC